MRRARVDISSQPSTIAAIAHVVAYNRRVLRSRALDKTVTRLALLAVLLLALAPSVSRVLASATPQVLAGWSELCTTMGLKTLPSEARSFGDASPAAPKMPGAEACDSCPLAASLSLLLLVIALLPPVLRRHASFFHIAPRLRIVDNLRGLGSRGPPILL